MDLESITYTSYEKQTNRVVVGLQGGVDSSVSRSPTLRAQAMKFHRDVYEKLHDESVTNFQ